MAGSGRPQVAQAEDAVSPGGVRQAGWGSGAMVGSDHGGGRVEVGRGARTWALRALRTWLLSS